VIRKSTGAIAGKLALVAAAGVWLAACAGGPKPEPATYGSSGTMRPYQINGTWYWPAIQPHYDESGLASWYGPQSRYRTTANGEAFDERVASAAHRTLPLPCIVEVTNLDNGRKARLRVNDRGPFAKGRILDVSRRGAEELGFLGQGTAHVRVRYVGPAPGAQFAWREDLPTARTAPEIRAPAPVPSPTGGATVRVQAATFALRANAERAATDLATAGVTTIEGVSRGGQTLWRVVVTGRNGETSGELRQAVAGAGFSGAITIGPS
jgi:rare lipoprotein A